MKNILLCVFIIFILVNVSLAGTIPYEDFVKVTDGVLDALDEFEPVAWSSKSLNYEIRTACNRLAAANKKYERYLGPDGAFDKEQGDIAFNFTMIESNCRFGSFGSVDDLTNMDAYSKKGRELFNQYKIKRGKK